MAPNRKNGAQHVYCQLKRLLINYQIVPGKNLHPSDFTIPLKVSATPVRDAMQKLSGEQLLNFIPNKGFFTKVLDLVEMRELLELEYGLVQQAIAAVDADTATLEKIAQEMPSGLRSPAAFCIVFERLFEQVATACRSEALTGLLVNLLDRTHYVCVLDFEEEERRRNTARQLTAFIANLNAGRISTSAEILHEQLLEKLDRLPILVKEGIARSHQSCDPLARTLNDFVVSSPHRNTDRAQLIKPEAGDRPPLSMLRK